MAKNIITSPRFNMRANGTLYKGCYFRSGLKVITAPSNNAWDFSVDTGFAKYPNNLLAYGIQPGWVSATWDWVLRGCRAEHTAGTNIMLTGNLRSAGAQNVEVLWWTLGN